MNTAPSVAAAACADDSPMRLVVDVSDLSPSKGKSRGIYSYARHLVAGFARALPPGASMLILCNGETAGDFTPNVGDRVQLASVYDAFPSVRQRVLWCFVNGALTARRHGADIYFSPKGFAPIGLRSIGGVRRVVITVHDLIPLWYARHFPQTVGRLERGFINGWLTRSVRRADRVVAISQATADAVGNELDRRSGVTVVHNGVPPLPEPTVHGPRDRIFAMTSPLVHKNLGGVLAAYARYRERVAAPLPMTVCGVVGDFGAGVTAVADITPIELANLYAQARVFLFLPLIEGFGFPVVESLAHGTPVVCSDIASLRESSLGAATYVPPTDADACAAALAAVTMTVEGSAASAAPPRMTAGATWDACARRTLDVVCG